MPLTFRLCLHLFRMHANKPKEPNEIPNIHSNGLVSSLNECGFESDNVIWTFFVTQHKPSHIFCDVSHAKWAHIAGLCITFIVAWRLSVRQRKYSMSQPRGHWAAARRETSKNIWLCTARGKQCNAKIQVICWNVINCVELTCTAFPRDSWHFCINAAHMPPCLIHTNTNCR